MDHASATPTSWPTWAGAAGSALSGLYALVADAPAQMVGAVLGVAGSVAVPCLVAWIGRRAEVRTAALKADTERERIRAAHDAEIAALRVEVEQLRARLAGTAPAIRA